MPTDISVLGAKYFEVRIDAIPRAAGGGVNGKTTILLFDEGEENIGNLVIEEEFPRRSVRVRYYDVSDDVWLRISLDQTGRGMTMLSTTSTGKSLETDFRLDNNGRKMRVLAVTLNGENNRTEFTFDENSDVPRSRLGLQRSLQLEEERLFDIPGLQRLREFVKNAKRMTDIAFESVDSRIRQFDNHGRAEPDDKLQLPESTNCNRPDLAPCSGTAFCQRISVLGPVFACVGGGTGCNGTYIIPDDILVFFPIYHTCAYLNDCA